MNRLIRGLMAGFMLGTMPVEALADNQSLVFDLRSYCGTYQGTVPELVGIMMENDFLYVQWKEVGTQDGLTLETYGKPKFIQYFGPDLPAGPFIEENRSRVPWYVFGMKYVLAERPAGSHVGQNGTRPAWQGRWFLPPLVVKERLRLFRLVAPERGLVAADYKFVRYEVRACVKPSGHMDLNALPGWRG